MIIRITKDLQNDNVSIIRDNGSTNATVFPKKGPTSHDAIHYFVEKGLGLDYAFWGMIAKRCDFEEIQTIAKNAGHASAARAGKPEQHIVELLQAERLVECFEAEQWGPPSDNATFIAIAAAACAKSHVPLPPQLPAQLDTLRSQITEFQTGWSTANAMHVAEFEWTER